MTARSAIVSNATTSALLGPATVTSIGVPPSQRAPRCRESKRSLTRSRTQPCNPKPKGITDPDSEDQLPLLRRDLVDLGILRD